MKEKRTIPYRGFLTDCQRAAVNKGLRSVSYRHIQNCFHGTSKDDAIESIFNNIEEKYLAKFNSNAES